MNPTLTACLDDLASRIDENEEDRIRQSWIDFLEGRNREDPFVPPRRTPKPPEVEWPETHPDDNRVLDDPDQMLLAQFGLVSGALAAGGNGILNVRCNYGIAIMPSQFGCEVERMPDAQRNTPTAWHLAHREEFAGDSAAAIRSALGRGMPDLRSGLGGAVFDTAERFLEVLERWPVLGRWVDLYHPDAQGPIDTAEVVWGSEIFLAFEDDAELVHRFLDLASDHYIAFMRRWFGLVPPRDAYSAHWGHLFKGRIVLRDDSLMNLSPEIYREFIRDREGRCLRELGGGMIHFCGRGNHFIEAMSALREDGLTAINLSQPHLNDMEAIYRHTVDLGIALIGFSGEWAAKASASGRPLRGRVHSASVPPPGSGGMVAGEIG